MPGFTTRLGLYKPGGGSSGSYGADEQVDIDKINGNMDALDAVVGFPEYTSTTRPSVPFGGQTIYESDTKRYMRYNQPLAQWTEVVSPAQGLTMIKPTIVATGGSAVLSGSQIVCTAVNSISINNCFSSLYDDYLVLIRWTAMTLATDINLKLRVAGVDNAAAAYTGQRIWAVNGAAPPSVAQTINGTTGFLLSASTSQFGTITLDLFSPNKAEQTQGNGLFQSVGSNMANGTFGLFHNTNIQADGMTISVATGTVTCVIEIYGRSKG